MTEIIIKVVDWEEFPVIEKVRKKVFQDEQKVKLELDFDGKDENCSQLIAYLNKEAVGTARIRYLDEKTAKIERLAVLYKARGKGIGKKIMQKALEVIANENIPEVTINAQEYIKKLHQQLGFEQVGEVFQEAGIPHVKMVKKVKG
ncbi:MAG: GNAT family N-acetyltransferase [Richelia sp. RM2_1_2]|nr:GNAT family N-acetyltransferase [Richelia sp. SM2_1_7]NJM20045.1 GNAT family N-acetyltransferase [Richelia sp. SM1_7_0]NJN09311.1 GNAT family N-acetyltransferase [Richelia sp. RM1_1_1]NJO26978.1 GNAT family N-acetyltransferase [Richelia sp. SL_2_1]NJO59451.1 GNAT family N-acetyltransferase [Richelia sp. RM2_1_2]